MERWALAQTACPVAIRVPGGQVVHSSEAFPTDYATASRARVIRRGSRVALIGSGASVAWIECAADILKKSGVEPTIISQTFLSELDADLLESLKADHSVVVVAEDGSVEGGYGQKIAAFYGTSPMRVVCNGVRKGLYDRYSYSALLAESHLTPETIAADALAALNMK